LQHPFYVIDADDYTIKLANSAARRFGLSDHSTCYELTHRRSKPCEGDHFCPLAQVKETKQPVTVEHTHFDEQGRPRIIEVHGYPLMDNHGRVKAMIEYGIDITERRRVDEEIKKAAVEWQLTFDSIPDAVSIQDRELRLLRINKAFAELLQRSPEQMIGKVCHSLVHDSDSPHDFCPCQKTFSTGEATQQEIYEPKLNSYLEIDTSPIRSEEGEVVKCVHVIKNITDRKLSEQALRDSEEKYRSLVDNIGIGVALISRDMRILTLNKRMHEWFPHVNVNETPVCYRAFRTYSPGEECPDCPTQKTFLDGKIHELIDSRPVNGRMVTFRIVSTAVKDRSGHIVAAIEMVEDITERQHAEKRIRDYTHRIELINRELDDFTYIVSHDLKEPLRSIDAFTKFIIDDNKELINDEGKLYLDRIRVNASRMQRLIDDLLELSRLERTTNPFSPVPLEEIIKDVQFRLEIAIREKSAQIVTRGTLPVIPCDRVRLTEVFANLISNAIKFTDGKQPLIEIGAEEKPDVYRVYVKDNGPGIEKKYQEKIFALFQRLTKTQDIAGTGAGLAIVKKIVQLHGGEIWVESAPGQGSSFFFTLAKKQNNGGGKEYVRGEEISKDTSGRGSG
ncbi:MAG: PAS domain-containing protein, partial [Candidatus Omnitrophica bacterium]|nr:PAS domain-containing protein [Candidatus Omnitrophota bacterium]